MADKLMFNRKTGEFGVKKYLGDRGFKDKNWGDGTKEWGSNYAIMLVDPITLEWNLRRRAKHGAGRWVEIPDRDPRAQFLHLFSLLEDGDTDWYVDQCERCANSGGEMYINNKHETFKAVRKIFCPNDRVNNIVESLYKLDKKKRRVLLDEIQALILAEAIQILGDTTGTLNIWKSTVEEDRIYVSLNDSDSDDVIGAERSAWYQYGDSHVYLILHVVSDEIRSYFMRDFYQAAIVGKDSKEIGVFEIDSVMYNRIKTTMDINDINATARLETIKDELDEDILVMLLAAALWRIKQWRS